MKYKIQDLIDIEHFQHLQDRLNEIYSFPSSIIDNDGNILTATGWQDICTQFHRKNKECELECKKSDQYIVEHLHEANPAVSYRCPHGLVDNATPIIIDGVHYGNFFTGQFFLEKPDLDFFRKQAKKYGFDEKEYIDAVKKVPVWTDEQLNSYLLFIKGLIMVIAESGLKRLKEIETQKHLKANEELAKTILKTSMDGFWLVDTEGHLLEVNDAYCRMSGYTEQELLKFSISDLEFLQNNEEIAARIKKTISEVEGRFESKHRRKDGSIFDVEITIKYSPDEGGRCIAFIRDITKQKNTEKSLEASEAKYRRLIENSPATVFQFLSRPDGSYHFPYISDTVEKEIGVKAQDIMDDASVLLNTIHPDDREQFKKNVLKSAENCEPYHDEFRCIVNGEIYWAEVLSTPECLEDGSTLWDGYFTNVIKRKTAEEELRQRSKLIETLVKYAPVGLAISFIDSGDILYVNETFSEAYKIPIEKCTGAGPFLEYVYNDRKDLMQKIIDDVMSGDPERMKWDNIPVTDKETGETGYVTAKNFALEDQNLMISTVVDITERRLAESKLKESHDLLENLARLVPGLLFQFRKYPDGRSALPYASPGIKEIYEVTPEEVREDASINYTRYHPDDRDRVESQIAESARTLEMFDCEFRVVLPKQGLRWLWSQAIPTRLDDGSTLWHGIMLDITDRKNAEKSILESEERFRSTFMISPDSININRLSDGIYIDVNNGFSELSGYSREECIGKSSLDIEIWDDPADRDRLIDGLLKNGYVSNFEARFKTKDGRVGYGLMSARIIILDGEKHILSVTRDITERKIAEEERDKLETQLLQAQKMEAVGRLAGGVAHDFNNMLSIIIGNAEMALSNSDLPEPLKAKLNEILKASKRSADLTKQLLAYARKQTITPKVLNLDKTVEGMLKMLRRLIGEDIDLVWQPGGELWLVNIDPSQVDQILANLLINARDAITDVGTVVIETSKVTLDEAFCAKNTGAEPGDYVKLTVNDSGVGIDKNILPKLFEPFFTTKELGKGTGLGLALVYGIVKQNNGLINVSSVKGEGTTFNIYLPRYTAQSEKIVKETEVMPLTHGTETILLVEDEPSILKIADTILKTQGYKVLAASTPGEALSMAKEHAGEINLLISDVVMPEMNGRDLAKNLLSFYPNIKRLFMSGYTADVIAHRGVLDEGVNFIQKPFSMNDMAKKVREVLEQE